jgi:spermidine/putrescine transport system substrate-binding protein
MDKPLSQITRRTALAGAGATASALFLAACAPGSSSSNGLQPAKDLSDSEKVLVWDNWIGYMDEGQKTLANFTAATGIAVTYNDDIPGNTDYYNAAQKEFAAGKDIGADTACLTDWMDSQLIDAGYLQKLDLNNIPNHANMAPELLGATFDPKREYSVPYMSFMTVIAYNKKLYKNLTGKTAPTSVADLWDPKLKGQVVVLSEFRETIGLMLISKGIDITQVTEAQYQEAVDELAGHVESGQIYTKDQDYITAFDQGNAVAGLVWSGDLTWGDDYGYVIDPAGATLNTDSFIVPMGSPHKKNVEALINFYYDKQNAADLILGGVVYLSPVDGIQELVAAKDPELAKNELIFPSAEQRAKLQQFRTLSFEEHTAWSEAFNKAVGL